LIERIKFEKGPECIFNLSTRKEVEKLSEERTKSFSFLDLIVILFTFNGIKLGNGGVESLDNN